MLQSFQDVAMMNRVAFPPPPLPPPGSRMMTGRVRTHTTTDSPIGPLTLAATDGVLSGLYFPAHRHGPPPETLGAPDPAGFEQELDELDEYFRGRRTSFTVPLNPAGTDFQQTVWRQLLRIPFGERVSYTELALRVGTPAQLPEFRLARLRAVASANAHNPISILIPCHRVVGANGDLTGYAGGLARKRFLLELERPERSLF